MNTDAARWRFGVEHGFPHRWQRISPRKRTLGWRMPSQEPPNGVSFNPRLYPFYKTAEAAIDAAMHKAKRKPPIRMRRP